MGDKVTLMHMPTQTLVSAYMSEAQAHEAKQIVSGCDVSGSKLLLPCPRSVFVIGRCGLRVEGREEGRERKSHMSMFSEGGSS